MLRIERHEPAGGAVRLRLAGRLAGPWVDEVRAACEDAFHAGRGLGLDLRDVTFVDAGGVELLRGLVARQARLENGSTFVRTWLQEGRRAGPEEARR
jgi:hypothetical protein